MPYKRQPIPSDLLLTAFAWESIRSEFWSQLNPELARDCRLRAEGHRQRFHRESQEAA